MTEFLEGNGVPYRNIRHSAAFKSADIAESVHRDRHNFAKTVVVVIDGEMALVVVPASARLVLPELRDMFQTTHVRLATEDEFADVFPDCALGAMPPFGNLYGLAIYVEASLAEQPEIAFNAGTHTEVITMAYADFDRLVHPLLLESITV
ncbi:MAG TPA: YbaK/EbsC family protein [Lacunisphaera sp.]